MKGNIFREIYLDSIGRQKVPDRMDLSTLLDNAAKVHMEFDPKQHPLKPGLFLYLNSNPNVLIAQTQGGMLFPTVHAIELSNPPRFFADSINKFFGLLTLAAGLVVTSVFFAVQVFWLSQGRWGTFIILSIFAAILVALMLYGRSTSLNSKIVEFHSCKAKIPNDETH